MWRGNFAVAGAPAGGGAFWLAGQDAERLVTLLERLGLDVKPPRFAPELWLRYMGRDKKNEAGRITLILLDSLGRGAVVKDTAPEELRSFLAES